MSTVPIWLAEVAVPQPDVNADELHFLSRTFRSAFLQSWEQ